MNFFRSIALLGAVFTISSAYATILPENHLFLFDNPHHIANITQDQFNQIVDGVVAFYQPLAQIHGATLSANKLWDDSTVNASAEENGDQWVVNMYGGLARRDEITADGFAMVVCHELGHHFGGYPFYPGGDWAAAEGQADYFATETCAKVIWANDKDANAAARATIDPFAKAQCDAVWTNTDAQNICYRTSEAGQSLANLLGAFDSPVTTPKFNTPDPSKVDATNSDHPASQCRLDTYFNGALCLQQVDSKTIPGKNDPAGQDGVEAEKDAIPYSCMNAPGNRPACWFKSLTQ